MDKLEQSDVNILIIQYEHLKRKKFVFSIDIQLYIEIKLWYGEYFNLALFYVLCCIYYIPYQSGWI